jgi:hypothetical protein
MLDKNLRDCVCETQLVLDGNVNIYENTKQLGRWIEEITKFIQN